MADDDPDVTFDDPAFAQFVQDYEVAVAVIAKAAQEFSPHQGILHTPGQEDPYDHFGRAVLARLMNAEPRLTIARLSEDS